VLGLAEAGHLFELVGPDASVRETLSLFDRAMQEGTPIVAVVVTRDAASTGRPLGIVTAADLPRLTKFLQR
jgi:CBS domain-containing protein